MISINLFNPYLTPFVVTGWYELIEIKWLTGGFQQCVQPKSILLLSDLGSPHIKICLYVCLKILLRQFLVFLVENHPR